MRRTPLLRTRPGISGPFSPSHHRFQGWREEGEYQAYSTDESEAAPPLEAMKAGKKGSVISGRVL
ncbi:MAG: hypothetical protein AAF449_24375, partial [Myxococcota bacterium]